MHITFATKNLYLRHILFDDRTLFLNYCDFLSTCKNLTVLVRLERFQEVKFKSEK